VCYDTGDAKGHDMTETLSQTQPKTRWLNDEEAHALFDAEARRVMGISGEEFLRRYDAGEFDHHSDTSAEQDLDFWDLVLTIPFGR